jgi:transposase-like protein
MDLNGRRAYSAEFKLDVIKYAEENTNNEAAYKYGIDKRLIRRWKSQKHILEEMDPDKKAKRGRTKVMSIKPKRLIQLESQKGNEMEEEEEAEEEDGEETDEEEDEAEEEVGKKRMTTGQRNLI